MVRDNSTDSPREWNDGGTERALRRAYSGLDEAREAGGDVVEKTDELEAQANAADAAAGVVQRVADRTNVVALNASIEAAHAEGQQNGFAVVAEEINSLAAETQEYADEIARRIEDVRASANAVREAAERSADALDESGSELDAALDAMTDTTDALSEAAQSEGTVATDGGDASASEEPTPSAHLD